MWVSRIGCVVVCAAVASLLGLQSSAVAGLTILNQDMEVNRKTQEVVFHIVFNHAPDFTSRDALGRPAESFQYEIVPNATGGIGRYSLSDMKAVIRGDEITAGKWLPIRDGFKDGADPSPQSGGWGAIRGQVPYALDDNQMTFNIGFNLLGTTNGNMAYRVFTADFGATGTLIESGSSPISVPLPPSLPAAAGMLALLGGLAFRRRLAR